MRKQKFFIFILFMALLKAISAQPPVNTKVVVDYVNQYKDIAVFEMLRTRIPASITLAQGILESKSGSSRLATEGHNHFGIKCKSNWTGKVILEDDDDFHECFRFYEDGYESYQDHSNFLLSSNRYAYLFDLEVTDYKSWAFGLKEAGYATNPMYAVQLVDIIEKYNLKQYDRYTRVPPNIKDNTEKHEVGETNGTASTKAKENDSYTKIAIENKMKVADLLAINDLSDIKELRYGEVVYLKTKKNENNNSDTHIIQTGESMHDIAQQYGIKLSLLLERNGLSPGEEPSKGETITLNKKNKKEVKKRKILKDGTQTVDMRVHMGERSQSDSIIEAKYNMEVENYSKVDSEIAMVPVPRTDEVYAGNIAKKDNPVNLDNDDRVDEVINGELYHYVRKGETIYSLTKRYDISSDELKEWNKIKDSYIKLGQKLQVTNHEVSENAAVKTYTMNDRGYYMVQEGDSLKEIALHFSLSLEEISDLNNLVKPYEIKAGDRLKVTKTETARIYRPPFHVVKGGDTLESISRKYEMSVVDLKKLNSLKDANIKVGSKLFLQ